MTHYRLGLLGFPLKHSFSPQIHIAALKALGLEGGYDLYPCPPTTEGLEGLQGLLGLLRRGELHGLNVTIPHKIAIIPYLDELTTDARAIGAVNAIRFQSGTLVGDNFDYPAFLADLAYHLSQAGLSDLSRFYRRSALILGAGGSARAIVYGLLSQGWRVRIVSRRFEQSQELVRAFPMFPAATFSGLAELASSDLAGINLIVNATPLGMVPDRDSSAWPAGLSFPSNAFVYDLVYNPPETTLLRSARRAGLPTANGLGMLVQQAALSFRSWIGQEPPIDVMYQSINLPLPQYDHDDLYFNEGRA